MSSILAYKIDSLEMQILETIDELAFIEFGGGRRVFELKDELRRNRDELITAKKLLEEQVESKKVLKLII